MAQRGNQQLKSERILFKIDLSDMMGARGGWTTNYKCPFQRLCGSELVLSLLEYPLETRTSVNVLAEDKWKLFISHRKVKLRHLLAFHTNRKPYIRSQT